MVILDNLLNFVSSEYEAFSQSVSPEVFSSIEVFFFAVLIAFVSIFIWYFYKSLSQKSLIELNLNQYNWSKHPFFSKLIATMFYFLEYIIIMPLLILVWFGALSLIILLIAEEASAQQIVMLSAAMIGAVRILAYYRKEIAQDLAKLFPFITLSVFLLSPGAFDLSSSINQLREIPALFNNILGFLAVVVIVEIVLRTIYTLVDFSTSGSAPGTIKTEE